MGEYPSTMMWWREHHKELLNKENPRTQSGERVGMEGKVDLISSVGVKKH